MADRRREARYQEIERWLRSRVLQGVPGDPLPAESELAARYGVSRMTARQAVQNLAQEGLVERRRGAGTFVARQPLHRHEAALMSFTEDMRRRGLEASSRLIDASLTLAPQADIDALRLPTGARIVTVSRIRLADGTALAIENAALPADCAGVLAVDLESGSLHDALVGIGRVPTIAHSWISARSATAAERRLLGLASHEPLLVERRIIYDSDSTPLEHTESAYVASRYVIDAVFAVTTARPPVDRAHSAAPTAPALGPS
jgi:GntR family transcriptional regulator